MQYTIKYKILKKIRYTVFNNNHIIQNIFLQIK